MLGTDVDAGVIPRCLDALFHSLRRNLASPCTFKIDDASRIPYVQVHIEVWRAPTSIVIMRGECCVTTFPLYYMLNNGSK
jgi:hypothetical protein